jgi:UDP-GlcNAc3NAcA epimerase
LGLPLPPGVLFQDPVGYLEMVYLLSRCELVITDSGGLQKEAYFFQKPCITIRDQTEWTELVDAGYNDVVGVSKEKIIESKRKFIAGKPKFDNGLYGTGDAAERIVETLSRNYDRAI